MLDLKRESYVRKINFPPFCNERILFFMLVFIFGNSMAFSESACASQANTKEINTCARQRLELANEKLGKKYKLALDRLSAPDGLGGGQSPIRDQFLKAQSEWKLSVDNNCEVVLLLNSQGTSRTSQYLACKEFMILQRNIFIEKLILN